MPRKKRKRLGTGIRVRDIKAPKGFRPSTASKTARPSGFQLVFLKKKKPIKR